MYPAYIQLVAKCSSPSICSARATGWWKYFKKIKIILKTRLELLLGKINIFLNHNFHKRPVEVEPLNWNLRDETARQTQMWTRSKLGISEHSCFLIFQTDKIRNCLWNWHICNPRCETVEQISQKMVWEQICFGWKELTSFKKKTTTKHHTDFEFRHC